jgi:arsenate reductase
MAEGWTRYLHKDQYEVYSAGTKPGELDPWAVKVMAEAGINISGQEPKHVDELSDIPFDLVVTVCDNARESCPFFHGGGKRVHRSFDDPPYLARNAADEEEAMSYYRRIRDEIRDFVADLPDLFRERAG